MTKSRKNFLIAGLGIITIINLIALIGVAYNRIGEPDSTLNLSERELKLPYYSRDENNGLTLELKWRVPPHINLKEKKPEYALDFSVPKWLTKEKLLSLGFSEAELKSVIGNKPQNRPVFIVFEFNGPAYKEIQELITKNTTDQYKLKLEEDASRLVAIDAGLEFDALRTKYADRKQYAILRGNVRPDNVYSTDQAVMGRISSIEISHINVPADLRGNYQISDGQDNLDKFQASISFGKRLEPWMLSFTPDPQQ